MTYIIVNQSAHFTLKCRISVGIWWRGLNINRNLVWCHFVLRGAFKGSLFRLLPSWLWSGHSSILPLPFWPLSVPCLMCQRDTAGPLLPSALCWSPLLTFSHLCVCLAQPVFFAVPEPRGPACFCYLVPLQPLILWAAAACCICCTGRWSSSILGDTPAS